MNTSPTEEDPRACAALRKALAACERAVSGRCPDSAKACDKHRERMQAVCKMTKPPPPPPSPPPPKDFAAVAECGLHHCVALVESFGAAYSWATSRDGHRFGQLGWASDAEKCVEATTVDARRVAMPSGSGKPMRVAAGDAHTAIVDDAGGLYLCGSDRWLQLGQSAFWSKGKIWRRTPSRVELLERSGTHVVAAACGADHTLALDDQGRVWAFGRVRFAKDTLKMLLAPE